MVMENQEMVMEKYFVKSVGTLFTVTIPWPFDHERTL